MKKYDSNKLPNYVLILIIFVPLLFLLLLGIASIASSNLNNALNKGVYIGLFLAQRQIIFVCLGLILSFIVTYFIPYKLFERSEIIGFLYFLIASALIYVDFFAPTIKGARRWIKLGPINIQPSEFGKIVFVLMAAKLFSIMEKNEKSVGIKEIKKYINKIIALLIIPLLVAKGKDLGTVIHYGIILMAMLFVSKIKFRYIISIILISIALVGGILNYEYHSDNFRSVRIKEFIKGKKEFGYGGGYQTKQSVIGIGSGGIWGKGYGNGIQKYSYVPEIHTDFIFATISEEFGFLMSFIIFLSYISIFYSGITIAIRSHNCFAKFLATGIIFMIASQALINLYVVSGLIPVTGIPLPFLSYGGSSIVSLLISVGLLFNIVKSCNIKNKNIDGLSYEENTESEIKIKRD